MISSRPIELLSPAKNAEIGIEAINHGADAVYIGAPRFGARAGEGGAGEGGPFSKGPSSPAYNQFYYERSVIPTWIQTA